MSKDSNEYSKDQVDLAFQLLRAHEKMKKIGDEEIEGLKKINDLTKKIAHSNELMVKLKKSGSNLSKQIAESKNELIRAKNTLDSHVASLDISKKAAMLSESNLASDKNKLELAIKASVFDLDEVMLLERQLSITETLVKRGRENVNIAEMNVDMFSGIVAGAETKLRIDENILEKNKENIKLMGGIISKRKEDLRWAEKLYDVSKYTKGVLETITSPFLLLAGLLVIGLKRFVELDSAAKDFRNTTKLTKDQTSELTDQVESMSLEYGKFGIGVKEGYDAAAALTSQFGIMNKAVMENKDSVALLTANLGVTNENAAGFVRYMDQVGGMTKEQIANTAGFAKNLSKASGVPLDRIMEDVAHASEQARAMTGGSVINLIKASAQARKFGVDLNKVAAAARGMLDFNESINSELEASVLLGKNLSFMDARRYAFAGQLEKAQEATLKQIEKMGDFNALNVLQQEALAKASGYSVSDLQKMIKMKKDFNLLTGKEKDDYNALMKMKEADIKNNNSARDELKKMQMQSTMDTLNNSLSTLKNSLAQLLIPILKLLTPIIEGFAAVVGWIGEGTSKLNGFTQGLFGASAIVGLLVASFFGISASISKIISMSGKLAGALSRGVVGENGPQQPGMMGKLGNWVGGKFGKTTVDISKAAGSVDPRAGKGFSEFMGSISDGLSKISMNGVLKGAAALFIIGAALIPFAYAAKLLSEVSWEDIGKAAVGLSLLTVATLAIGAVMSSGVGTVAILAGAAAFILLGSALIPFGYGAKLAGEGMNLVGDGLSKIVPQLSSLVGMSVGLSTVTKSIIELGNAFNSFGVGSSDGLSKLLDTRVSQLQKLVDVGPQLQVTANAIKTISNPSADNSSTSTSSATSNEAVVKKLDELIGLLKSGAIAVNLDGRRVSSGLAAAVS
jgi:hypothetical protein